MSSPNAANDARLRMLEEIASSHYFSLYTWVDEEIDDLVGIPGLKAALVGAVSPALTRQHVKVIAMVSTEYLNKLPHQWLQLVEASTNYGWNVDFYVKRRDVGKLTHMFGERPNVHVFGI